MPLSNPTIPAQPTGVAGPDAAAQVSALGGSSLVDLAAMLAGVEADSREARALGAQLRVLEDLAPAYESVTRVTLESMVAAKQLQEHALRDLTPAQRQLVRDADPDRPPSPELREALSRVDMESVAAALAALRAGSDEVLRILSKHAGTQAPAPHGAESALREALGTESPAGPPGPRSVDPGAVAWLLADAAGLESLDAAALAHQLRGLPAPVVEALAVLAESLAPLSDGAGSDARDRLARLGAAADAAAPVLEVWSAVALAGQLRSPSFATEPTALPNPDAPSPPLRWGARAWTYGPPPPLQVTAGEAGRGLAALFLPADSAQAVGRDVERVVSGMSPQQAEAVARVLEAARQHVERHQAAAATYPPDGVSREELSRWAAMAAEGTMPDPSSPDAARLLETVPYLEAQRRAAVGTDRLLEAVEQLVPAFQPQQPTSGHQETPGCQEDVQVLFLLAIDTCGGNSDWDRDVILRVDTGGDDAYKARIGAPFLYDPADDGVPPEVFDSLVGVPVAISVDLGGNDTYTTPADCAQGAACPDHEASASDPTGVSGVAPVAILVDWGGDGAVARNTFQAGNRSQGFLALTSEIPQILGRAAPTDAVAGILVERVGQGSRLESTYTAREKSQGSGVDAGVARHGGRGLLVRLVGSDSTAEAVFEAGRSSQGSVFQGGLKPVPAHLQYDSRSLGALLNIAGTNATSSDSYTAGAYSQAAIDGSRGSPELADAVFADVAGPGGGGDDTYHIDGPGRAHLIHPVGAEGEAIHTSMYVLFLDAALPDAVTVGGAVEVETSDGQPTITVAPSLGGARTSNDTYSGPIGPGMGYGWISFLQRGRDGDPEVPLEAGFYDVGGLDTYLLPEAAWSDTEADSRPRNDGTWPAGAAPGSIDVDTHDDDRDGYPAALEQLWPFWAADPGSAQESPQPVRSYVSLDEHRDAVLDGPHALVLSLGGDDTYLGNHSATVHVDVAGDDVYLGRTGAASGVAAGADAPSGGGSSQHVLSFLLDIQGDDRYESARPRNQGYGDAGAVGVLLDMAGSDRYVAPDHAQGVAASRDDPPDLLGEDPPVEATAAVGVLVDLGVPGGGDWNWFQADAPSQGHSDGGLGLLVATGGHNTFPDGVDSEPLNGTSANLGANAPPELDVESLRVQVLTEEGLLPAAPPLQAEQAYNFSVLVRDPDGDPVRVCWTFGHGDPASHGAVEESRQCAWHGDGRDDGWRLVEANFTWDRAHPVHTDATMPGREANVTYSVTVDVTDAGGASAETLLPVEVANPPPRLLGGVDGQADAVLGAAEAYQVPFLLEDDTHEPSFVVDWGDGSRTVTQGDTIDWALATRGTVARTPESVPRVLGGGSAGVEAKGVGNAIDGDPGTAAAFRFDPVDFPLVHVILEFPTLRQVGRIGLDAHALSMAFDLSVEGIDAQGQPVPMGTIHVDSEGASGDVVVPERPLVAGVVLRQMLPPDHSVPPGGFLNIKSIRAMGPGAEKVWSQTGERNVTFAVIDELGGRNATSLNVTVRAPAVGSSGPAFDETRGDIRDIPLRLLDVADRGPVRHASVGAYPASQGDLSVRDGEDIVLRDARERPLRLLSLTDEGADDPCATDADGGRLDGVCAAIDWGDGSPVQRVGVAPVGEPIEVFHRWTDPGDHTINLTYETRSGSVGPHPVATVHVEQALDLRLSREEDSTPLLFVTLEDRTTWHTGAPYPAIVDAAGDDRYFDAVASAAAGPAFVVDAAGDDDYLSSIPRTQGFGALASVALLVDAAGDDRYVAPGRAQGAAESAGAGMLVDLGGDDVWNPVPSDHPAISEGRPDRFEPWAGSGGLRPAALNATRPSLVPPGGPGFELMQGAAEEGIGVLLAHGGADLFVAGDRSQGYGAHDPRVEDARNYTLPNPGCLNLDPGQINLNASSVGFYDQFLCLAGIQLHPDTLDSVPPSCPPIGVCNPDLLELNAFLLDGPRYGPGVGLLLRPDGPAGMRAGSLSQASSTESGRGLLFDLDGASVLTASDRGQAYAVGSTSVLAVGGPHSTWLRDEGQFLGRPGDRNPEGVDATPAPQALVYLGGPRDPRCEGASCSGGSPAPTSVDSATDPTPGAQAPVLTWGDATEVDFSSGLPTHRAGGLLLEVEVATGSPGTVETVVLSMVHPSDGDGVCGDEPIAGPIILDPLARRPAGTTSFTVDLDLTRDAHDGRLLPAGCHRIHAFARVLDPTDTRAVTEWGVLPGEARVLPAPPARLAGEAGRAGTPAVATGGTPVPITVFVPEPLAGSPGATAQPVVDLAVTLPDGTDATGWSIAAPGGWQPAVEADQTGATRLFVLDPPDGSGAYRIEAQTAWSGAAGEGARLIADLIVDKDWPEAALDPARTMWRGGQQMLLSGTVEDVGVGVDRVELRMVRNQTSCLVQATPSCLVDLYIPSLAVDPFCADGRPHHCVLEVVPSFPVGLQPTRPCPSEDCHIVPPPFTGTGGLPSSPVGGTSQQAVLEPTGEPGRWTWSASMRTTSQFRGGEVVVQARTVDNGGTASGWRGLTAGGLAPPAAGQVILVDKSAPEALEVAPAGGAAGTNLNHPIPLDVVLRDCAADPLFVPECTPGSGVAPTGLTALVRDLATDVLAPVKVGQLGLDGGNYVATLEWQGPVDGPAQGAYEVMLQARDEAGNILSLNPGVVLHVDREPPVFAPSSVRFAIPEGQAAVKPDDAVNATVRARDVGAVPTWVDRVTASVGDSVGNLTAGDVVECAKQDPADPARCLRVRDGTFEGQAVVPDGLLADGQPDVGIPVHVTLTALDAGGNSVTLQSGPFTYYEEEPGIHDLTTTLRSESIDLVWNTTRPVEVGVPTLTPLDGQGAPVEGSVETDGLSHLVRFGALEPATAYAASVPMRDAAGFTIDVATHLGALQTLVKADADIALVPPAAATYAGNITLEAAIQNAVPSRVTLHEGSASSPALASVAVDPDLPGEQDMDVPLTFDSRQITDTLAAARNVTIVAVMDDGESFWNASLALRIDNAPPEVSPFVDGPQAHMGDWYNATVVVHAGSHDDTFPIAHAVVLDDGPPVQGDQVKIAQEGEHIVRFLVEDGAVSPNHRTTTTRIVIDATAPALEASVAGGTPAVRERNVSLAVSAQDPGAQTRLVAGLEGVRVRLDDGAWTDWTLEPPTSLVIPEGPDGHHWIRLEARDAVHNVARTSVPLLLDSASPEVLSLSWIGTSGGDHVLEFVVHDRLNGTGRPAGIVAMRHGTLDGDGSIAGPWSPTDGVGSLKVSSLAGDLAIEFVDAAGNAVLAELPPLPAPVGTDAGAADPGDGTDASDAPPRVGAGVLRAGRFVPEAGPASQPFTFSVVAYTREGVPPDAVWLQVAGMREQMRSDSGMMDDGGRLYTATVELPATRLDAPHTYRFEATYGDETVATAASPGPMVVHLDQEEVLGGSGGGGDKGIPAAPPLAALALAALVAVRRRNDP